jgi:cell division protein FtsB
MKRSARPIIRFAGRVTATALGLLVVTLVAIQFGRAIAQNVGAARELSSLRSDVGALERRRDDQQRELKRLRDPQGVVPEIHDRLRLVRPNEVLIFVSPQPPAGP